MVDFVEGLGLAFLPHVLIRVADRMVAGTQECLGEAGITTSTRTTSTLMLLDAKGPRAVTEIARELQQSHQLVMVWIDQLKKLGLVSSRKDPADARRTIVSLTPEGSDVLKRQRAIASAEERAFRALMDEADAHVFDALWRLEKALRSKPYAERLREELHRAGRAPDRASAA